MRVIKMTLYLRKQKAQETSYAISLKIIYSQTWNLVMELGVIHLKGLKMSWWLVIYIFRWSIIMRKSFVRFTIWKVWLKFQQIRSSHRICSVRKGVLTPKTTGMERVGQFDLFWFFLKCIFFREGDALLFCDF